MFEMTKTVAVDPPRLVWIRQIGHDGDVGLPGLLHAWRVHRRKGTRWEGEVTMFDRRGLRVWHGWVSSESLLPWVDPQR